MKTTQRPTTRSRNQRSIREARLSAARLRRRALFVERLEERMLLATIVWDGEGGDNAWGNAANWFDETNGVNNVLPAAADDVEIRAPFAGQVISLVSGALGTTVSINSLQSASGLLIQAGSHAPTSLLIASTAQLDGPVSLVSGNFGGGGALTIGDRLTWSGGSLAGGGTLIVAPGATLAFDSPGSPFSTGSWTIENQGTLDWIRGGLSTSDPMTINNRPGGLFNVRDGNSFGSGNSGRIINNEGTLRKSEGMGRSQIGMIFNNTGSVEVQAGTLALVKGGVSSGNFSFDAGTTLELRGGDDFFNNSHTITLGPGDSIAGEGRLLIADRPITIQGTGTVEIASLEISTRASSRFNLNLDASVPKVLFASGFIGGTGTLTVTESMSWTGGQLNEGGTVLVAPDATLTLDATSVGITTGGGNIDNHGTFRWLRGAINASSSSRLTLHNRAGALFDIQSNAAAGAASSVVHNAGIIRKSAGTGRSELRMAVNSTGSVEVQTGTLALQGGGNSTGNFSFAAGTTLELWGNFPGSPNVPNTITLDSASSITGSGRLLIGGGGVTIGGSGLMDVQQLELQGNFVDLDLDLDTSVPVVLVTAGRLGGSGTLTVTENMTWSNSSLADGGTNVIGPSATLTISGSTSINDNDSGASPTHTIDNHGTIQWLSGDIFIGDPLVLRNRPGAVFDIRGDATLGHQGSLINEGTLRKTAGAGTTAINTAVSNTGAIEVHSGTLRLQQPVSNWSSAQSALIGGTWLVSTADPLVSTATLRLDGVSPFANNRAKITLDGPGTSLINQSSVDLLRDLRQIDPAASLTIENGRDYSPAAGDFTNGGTLTVGPESTVSVSGQYIQSAEARLAIGLGGDAASGLFGHLAATGNANLDGTFELRLYDGFGPTTGQSWQVMS
ncbi:MAG TPA: hypothetical protein VFV87_10360, partial [Pirellulaceae bacterium]|nr:hypothetical protein [Pirellulaceae bacterium]